MSMAGGGYLPRRFSKEFLTDVARWQELREDHFQIICMVSEIFNPACEWKELLKYENVSKILIKFKTTHAWRQF